jgi:hypothetical protein
MIYQQLRGVSDMLAEGGGELLSVRPNYGTGIIPSMYGAEIFIMPRRTNTLPGTRPLCAAAEDVKRILDRREMDFSKALAGRVFNFTERWLELSRPYESIRRSVYFYNPDLQGPLPLTEMLWGSNLYLDIFDEPQTVHAALGFFAEVMIGFLKKFHNLCPPFDGEHSVEWGPLHRGAVILRDDAAMNISGEMYKEFVRPEDQKIIDAFGGGVHFRGKGDHYIEAVSEIRGLSTINLSQPECNDMEIIYRNTIDKGIVIIGLPSAAVKKSRRLGAQSSRPGSQRRFPCRLGGQRIQIDRMPRFLLGAFPPSAGTGLSAPIPRKPLRALPRDFRFYPLRARGLTPGPVGRLKAVKPNQKNREAILACSCVKAAPPDSPHSKIKTTD